MNTHNTLEQLRKLQLGGMAEALQMQLEQVGTYAELAFTERLDLLLDHERQCRQQRKQQRLIRQAKFKLLADLRDMDYRTERDVDKSTIAQLALCHWIERSQNLLITGACGCGKTFLACALGHQACRLGLSVRYAKVSRLLLELTQAKADGSYAKTLSALSNIQLLILDDWGMQPLSEAHRHDLMEIMDDRYGYRSTAVLSQLPTDQWYNCIGDNTLADAILDRLMHNAHRIVIHGESMRKRNVDLS